MYRCASWSWAVPSKGRVIVATVSLFRSGVPPVSPIVCEALLLAQGVRRNPFADPAGPSWMFWLVMWGFAFVGMAYTLFWVWMLIHSLRFEPDKTFWIWLLIVAPFPGAIVYFVARVLPAADWKMPVWLQRYTRSKELGRLASATEAIGNAHQFVQYGDALRETAQWTEAGEAYRKALKKDPESLPALWGAAQVAIQQKQWTEALPLCRQILERDANYRFGDVSFTYAKTLLATGDTSTGRTHLEKHCQRWRSPEAIYLLAERCAADGDTAVARQHLTECIRDINGSPSAIARKQGRWKSQARRLLQKLPRDS